MNIDFSSLASAIGQLEKSLAYARSEIAQHNEELFEQLRNSVIQCLEFTYDLSWKMLKRYLEETAAMPEEIDMSTFQNLIRMAIIKDTFAESNLPIRVDVVDWSATSASFQEIIRRKYVVIQESSAP